MSAGLKVGYLLTFAPDMKEWPKRTVQRGFEAALAAIGQLWFREFLPRHFMNLAVRGYGYQRRDKDYQIKKAKTTKRTAPLVGLNKGAHRAGTLKRTAMRTGLVRATSKKVSVRFQVPAYAKSRGRLGTGPDMIAEMTAISEKEKGLFFEVFEKVLVHFLRHEPKRKRVRSGAK